MSVDMYPDDLVSEMLADVEAAEAAAASKQPSATLADLAMEFEETARQLDEAKAITSQLQQRFDELRKKEIPEAMQREGMVNAQGKGSFTLSSGARISLRNDVYASVKKEDEKEFFAWLRQGGNAAMIREQVNAQTLKAFARDMIEEGVEPPPQLKVTKEQSASLTRAKR